MSTFTQKFRGHSTKYSFDEQAISYEYADSEESVAFDVKYNEIDVDNAIRSTSKNPIWKFASLPFLLLALFAIGKASLIADSFEKLLAALLVAVIWILVASIFWVKYVRSEVSLTMFDSVRGRLIIVHDGQEVEIINLLQKLVDINLSTYAKQDNISIQ